MFAEIESEYQTVWISDQGPAFCEVWFLSKPFAQGINGQEIPPLAFEELSFINH